MNIALLFNPSSGTGRRTAVIEGITAHLRQDGHRVLPMRVGGPEMQEGAARQNLAASDVLLIAGGDGTVHRTLPLAISTGVPIYHVPLGTENLFARHFGMRSDPAEVSFAMSRGRVETVDTGVCNGTPFAIMCSAGPDADVIHRLSAARTGGISHLTYLRPILAEALCGGVAEISIEVDGKIIVEQRRGMVVVANGEHYGLGANPCADASMRDGLLDVAFFPTTLKLGAGLWLLASRARLARWLPGCIRARGERVAVVSDAPSFRLQMDGEAITDAGGAVLHDQLDIGIRPRSLRVLVDCPPD